MKVLRSRKAFQNWRSKIKKPLGLVPTMGALHEGHLSLVRKSQKENEYTAVTIFVNPTQFAPNEDLSRYPRTEKEDLAALKRLKVDAVFLPKSPEEIYLHKDETTIKPRSSLLSMMEAKIRPGHFEGVATVVCKLFQLANAQRAYFGKKDYQQLCIIEAMVEDLFLPVKIRPCPIVREKNGLAMSSRNRYLDDSSRLKAGLLYRVLSTASNVEQARAQLASEAFEIDYIEVWDKKLANPSPNAKGLWLAAVRWQGVRLIDNCERF